MNRRRLLSLGAIIAVTGCIDNNDQKSVSLDNDSSAHEDPQDRDEYQEYDKSREYEAEIDEDGDSDEEQPPVEFEGFTHFPVDFSSFFSEPRTIDLDIDKPIRPFFSDAKVVGAGKWYLRNPHDDAPIDPEWGYRRSTWKTYLVTDAVVEIVAFADFPVDEVDGETVYLVDKFEAHPTPDVTVLYENILLREPIVNELEAGGGEVFLSAGTHLGYALNAFWVWDWRFDVDGVNPFDYFSAEKQQELLELYQPVYDIYRAEGIEPFTDLTESRLSWDVHGSLEGGWIREAEVREVTDNGAYREWYGTEKDGSLVALFPNDILNGDTYWRVIDHPWNQENTFVGRFAESEIGTTPEIPLYPGETLGRCRFYLLDGDLGGGIALIIRDWEWRPLDPISETNHPSIGERRYLRFAVFPGEDSVRDTLKLQGFMTEDEARSGFTDKAIVYSRYRSLGYEYHP